MASRLMSLKWLALIVIISIFLKIKFPLFAWWAAFPQQDLYSVSMKNVSDVVYPTPFVLERQNWQGRESAAALLGLYL